jgi:hypothetical protein
MSVNPCPTTIIADVQPCFPDRSRLFQLQPIAIGTPQCESLTCYIQRLAEAHSVSVLTFIKELIAPNISKEYIHKDASRGCSRFFQRVNVINGLGVLSRQCVTALESLTLKSDLSSLTLQRYSDVFVAKTIGRSYKSWCPNCLYHWEKQNKIIYEPLLWTVSEVRVCPIHQLPLENICSNPACNKQIPLLAPNSVVGRCSYCTQWLGEFPKTDVTLEGIEKELWISQSIGTMISITDVNEQYDRKHICISFQTLCNQLTKGNIEALSILLDIPKSTIYQYYHGKHLPLLRNILDICYNGHISVVDFLQALPFRYIVEEFKTNPRTMITRFRINWLSVKDQLLTMSHECPPPSLNVTTQRLQISIKTLKRRFPELMRTIKNNYRAYLDERANLRMTTLCQQVIDATHQLYNENLTPTARAVEKKICKPGALRRREVSHAWREARRSRVGSATSRSFYRY